MSEMKMSDVFGLPLVVCRNNPQMITAKPTYKGKTDFYYATIRSPVELEVSYATYAVNNHDRMMEEIADLRGFVKKVSELDIETFRFETQGGDEDCIEYVCTDIVDDAVDLLEKLNQEGEE